MLVVGSLAPDSKIPFVVSLHTLDESSVLKALRCVSMSSSSSSGHGVEPKYTLVIGSATCGIALESPWEFES